MHGSTESRHEFHEPIHPPSTLDLRVSPSASHDERADASPGFGPVTNVLHPPAFYRDGEAFIDALKQRNAGAVGYVFDRYHRRVDRTLFAVLGPDPDRADLVQEVFTRLLDGLPRFRGDLETLEPWITRIAVYTARGHLRRRQTARRWTRPQPPEPIDVPSPQASPEVVDALGRAYALIERLPVKERIPFVLRYMDQMKLGEVAHACDISLATTKRRLERARDRLDRYAKSDPILIDWMRRKSAS